MHAAVLLWGFTGVLGRAITLDFPVLVWWRMLLTGLFIAIIITARKAWTPVSKKDFGRLILVGILMGMHWVAFYGAIKFANASIALICLSTSPIFTSVLDPLVNRSRWQSRELLIGSLAIAGVAVIALMEHNATGPATSYTGITLGVAAALLAAVFTVLNKSIAAKYPARTMVFWEMTSGWAFITISLGIAIAAGAQKWLLNPQTRQHSGVPALQLYPVGYDWLWMLLLSLCCTVWAQSLALTALKKLSSFTVTLSVNLEPVYGILLAFLFFQENEELGYGFYLGVGLIVLSVALQMGRMLWQRNNVAARGGID